MGTERLVIFAKEPIPGQVKTRIGRRLGAVFAAEVARRLLTHAGGLVEAFCRHKPTATVHWFVSPDPHSDYWHTFAGQNREFHAQAEGDLGQRMTVAIRSWVSDGDAVVCIGMDCPFLTVRDLLESFETLERRDAVIQPAQDGGYVLIGLRQWGDGFFDHMPWSSEHVLARTIQRFEDYGLEYESRPVLSDIDHPEDLELWV